MNERKLQVHYRAKVKEKMLLERNAKKCGLPQSEYLRQLVNGYQPKPLPPLDYRELKDRVTDLHMQYYEDGDAKYADLMVEILKDMIAAITPTRRQ
jgi:hypothetical protein